MITGKNKEQFEEWLLKQDIIGYIYVRCDFDDLPLSMQWGVYLEYYDNIESDVDLTILHYKYYTKFTGLSNSEIKELVLKKANELYN